MRTDSATGEKARLTLDPGNTLVIACGAISHEIVALRRANGWTHITLQCLPADLHNRPERIPGAVRRRFVPLAASSPGYSLPTRIAGPVASSTRC